MSSKGRIIGLGHIGLYVSDIEVSKKYYAEILGFKVIHENQVESEDGVVHAAFLQLEDIIIEIIKLPEPDFRPDGAFDHLAIRVENIEYFVDLLTKKGIEFEEKIYHAPHFWQKGAKWVLFRGPDHEHLELTEIL